ncbi:MAG: hypothetical protein ACR2NM_03690, partial [Bythopirellula sp.]
TTIYSRFSEARPIIVVAEDDPHSAPLGVPEDDDFLSILPFYEYPVFDRNFTPFFVPLRLRNRIAGH